MRDGALRELVRQARSLWDEIGSEFEFDNTILDLYADVREEGFDVKLIEKNPWGAHLGTGSLLFHWIDDRNILEPEVPTGRTVLRLVQARSASSVPVKYLPKAQVNEIGHGRIIEDELKVLRQRNLEWLLVPKETQRLMSLPVPGKASREITVTRAEALNRLRREYGVEEETDCKGSKVQDAENGIKLHARFKRMQRAFVAEEGIVEESLGDMWSFFRTTRLKKPADERIRSAKIVMSSIGSVKHASSINCCSYEKIKSDRIPRQTATPTTRITP